MMHIRHERLFLAGIAIIVIALTMFVVMLQLKTALYWITDYDYIPEEEIWNPFLNHRILPYNTALLVSGGVLTLAGWFGNAIPHRLFRNAYKKT